MGFMSQRYVLHCCLVYLTEEQKYLTKIIKCDEELILKDMGSIDMFKEKIVKGEFLENDIFLYERSQNGSEVYIWECKPTKKDVFGEYICDIDNSDDSLGEFDNSDDFPVLLMILVMLLVKLITQFVKLMAFVILLLHLVILVVILFQLAILILV